MTSSPTPGFSGVFKVATVAIVQVKSCEIQIKGATYDVTVMNGLSTPAWKAFLAGLKEWTLKIIGNYDLQNDAVQNTLWTNFLSGTINAISFSPNTGTNSFTGNAFITSMPFKFDVKAEDTAEFDLQGSGALSYA